MGVATCVAFLGAYGYASVWGGSLPTMWDLLNVWTALRVYSDTFLGAYGVVGLFAGMWLGAASHTLTDVAGTYVKTGRV